MLNFKTKIEYKRKKKDLKINPLSSPNTRNCVANFSYKLSCLLFTHTNTPYLHFSGPRVCKTNALSARHKKKRVVDFAWLIWINQIKTKHKSISGSNTLCREREKEIERGARERTSNERECRAAGSAPTLLSYGNSTNVLAWKAQRTQQTSDKNKKMGEKTGRKF